jgi:hypothetical protein
VIWHAKRNIYKSLDRLYLTLSTAYIVLAHYLLTRYFQIRIGRIILDIQKSMRQERWTACSFPTMVVVFSHSALSISPSVSSLLFVLIEQYQDGAPHKQHRHISRLHRADFSSRFRQLFISALGAAGAYIMRLVRKATGTPEPSPINVQILEVLGAQLNVCQTGGIGQRIMT